MHTWKKFLHPLYEKSGAHVCSRCIRVKMSFYKKCTLSARTSFPFQARTVCVCNPAYPVTDSSSCNTQGKRTQGCQVVRAKICLIELQNMPNYVPARKCPPYQLFSLFIAFLLTHFLLALTFWKFPPKKIAQGKICPKSDSFRWRKFLRKNRSTAKKFINFFVKKRKIAWKLY